MKNTGLTIDFTKKKFLAKVITTAIHDRSTHTPLTMYGEVFSINKVISIMYSTKTEIHPWFEHGIIIQRSYFQCSGAGNLCVHVFKARIGIVVDEFNTPGETMKLIDNPPRKIVDALKRNMRE